MSDRAGLVVAPGAQFPRAESAAPEPDPLKGGDVYKWAVDQAALIRAGRYQDIDWINVADEIDSVGRSEFSDLRSNLAIVIQHMLKWDHQPERRSRSWELSIREHRRRVQRGLRENPSLQPRLDEAISEGFADGRDRALAETGLSDASIPAECPYAPSDVFDRPFVHREG